MYSDRFEGIHEHTDISYEALFPATPGPGGEWVAIWKTFSPHPAGDLPGTDTYNAFAFASPQRRAAWWKVVRKNIIWMRTVPTACAVEILPDRNWLDLTGVTESEAAA